MYDVSNLQWAVRGLSRCASLLCMPHAVADSVPNNAFADGIADRITNAVTITITDAFTVIIADTVSDEFSYTVADSVPYNAFTD